MSIVVSSLCSILAGHILKLALLCASLGYSINQAPRLQCDDSMSVISNIEIKITRVTHYLLRYRIPAVTVSFLYVVACIAFLSLMLSRGSRPSSRASIRIRRLVTSQSIDKWHFK